MKMITNFVIPNYNGLEKRIKQAQKNMIKMIGSFTDVEEYKKTIHFKKNMKKMHKAIYLKEKYGSFERYTSENLINHFRKHYDYDSWVDIYVFKKVDLEIIKNELEEELYVEIDGSSWSSPYDCTGRAFYRNCKFIELSDRFVVTQSGGLDV
jgi:hypothetical protein